MNPGFSKTFKEFRVLSLILLKMFVMGRYTKTYLKANFHNFLKQIKYLHSRLTRINITIWPILLVINEISLEKRFCLDNIIVAGVSVAITKPEFEVFVTPIVKQMKTLELGMAHEINNSLKVLHLFLLFGIFEACACISSQYHQFKWILWILLLFKVHTAWYS